MTGHNQSPSSGEGALLLTGGTGFIGMEVLARLIESGDRRIYALVRAANDSEAHDRLRAILTRTTGLIPAPIYMTLMRPLIHRIGSPRRREALRRNEVFVPYFSMRLRYGDARTRRRLARARIAVPPVERYFDRLIDFAVRARWGRVDVPRVAAGGKPALVS